MFTFMIHGFGGQGIETTCRILGKSAFLSGFNVQDFTIYTHERRGAPTTAYVKIDKDPILSKEVPEEVDFFLIFDMSSDIKEILKNSVDSASVIFNSEKKVKTAYLKKHKIKSHFVDATNIACEIINKSIPNIVMLGGLCKIFNKITLKNMKNAIIEELGENREILNSLDEGYKKVR